MEKQMDKNETYVFVLACVVKGRKDRGLSGQISKELLDELYEILDRISLWQKGYDISK